MDTDNFVVPDDKNFTPSFTCLPVNKNDVLNSEPDILNFDNVDNINDETTVSNDDLDEEILVVLPSDHDAHFIHFSSHETVRKRVQRKSRSLQNVLESLSEKDLVKVIEKTAKYLLDEETYSTSENVL